VAGAAGGCATGPTSHVGQEKEVSLCACVVNSTKVFFGRNGGSNKKPNKPNKPNKPKARTKKQKNKTKPKKRGKQLKLLLRNHHPREQFLVARIGHLLLSKKKVRMSVRMRVCMSVCFAASPRLHCYVPCRLEGVAPSGKKVRQHAWNAAAKLHQSEWGVQNREDATPLRPCPSRAGAGWRGLSDRSQDPQDLARQKYVYSDTIFCFSLVLLALLIATLVFCLLMCRWFSYPSAEK
jgi:hypothetical protein